MMDTEELITRAEERVDSVLGFLLPPDLIAALRAEKEARGRAEAMVAAAYRDAADLILRRAFGMPESYVEYIKLDYAAILARTPADAQAALDRLLQQAEDEALERAASKAEDHLHDWANDLAATRDQLIDAQATGVWNGRKIRDKDWLKAEARRFGERAESVAESADHTAAAIRVLKGGA
jgi:hypothetical protein